MANNNIHLLNLQC